LDELQKATMVAIYKEVGLSTNAHVPFTSIQRHFRRDLRGFCKDAMKDLIKIGLVNRHPTGGSMTYSLTPEGISELKEILDI
jgi:predicted transcriptional regulator